MAVGLATGMGHIAFAILITLLVSVAIFLFSKIKWYDKNMQEKILSITVPENLDYGNIFNDIFEKYTTEVILYQTKTINMGSLYHLTYKVILKDNINEKEFIDEIRVKNSNLKIVLSHPMQENEM